MPLGWVLVPHEGNSDLALQQKILNWLKEILPEKARAVIVADREFHSIHLAQWIEKELKLDYALRIKAGTYIEFDGQVMKTSEIAIEGESFQLSDVKITKDAQIEYRTNLTVHWAADEDEAWVLATNLEVAESIAIYAKRFWIEEMFSDHKSRGLNARKDAPDGCRPITAVIGRRQFSVFMVNGNRFFSGRHGQDKASG